jgi:hypothetical protein
MKSGIWRIIGGVAVLLVLAVITVRLLPAYVQNLRFQNALSVIVGQALESNSPDTMLLRSSTSCRSNSPSTPWTCTSAPAHVSRSL